VLPNPLSSPELACGDTSPPLTNPKQNAEEEQPAPSKKVYYIRMRMEPYRATQTEKALHGNVACELSPQLYGVSVWWVLLDDLEKVYSGQPTTV
jgi:hypothetical protein